MLYFKSTMNSSDYYSRHDGMTRDIVLAILADLGCTSIQEITEEQFLAAE